MFPNSFALKCPLKCHFQHEKLAFLILKPKTRSRKHQNVFLSSEIDRTHPNWSKTSKVCRKITSPPLNRSFFGKFHFWGFSAIISCRKWNVTENESWKSSKNGIIFEKTCDLTVGKWFLANLATFRPIRMWSIDFRAQKHILVHSATCFWLQNQKCQFFMLKMAL